MIPGYNSQRSDMTRRRTPPTRVTAKRTAAQTLGRLGGRAGTLAQNQARARNAQHAGRPKRVCTTCGAPVIGGHVDRRLDDTCGRHGWRWERAGAPHPTPPNLARTLILEALDALNNQETVVDLRDWTKAAKAFLGDT